MNTTTAYLTALFNTTYQFIAERSDRVYVMFDARKLQNRVFQSAVINGFLTLNLSSKACPHLSIKDGVINAPLTYQGVPTVLSIDVRDIVAMSDGYGSFNIPTSGWDIYSSELPDQDVSDVDDKVVKVDFGKRE